MSDRTDLYPPTGGRWQLDRNDAIGFLTSLSGVVLHELGHYAAANLITHVVGHIVVERSPGDPKGAFIFYEPTLIAPNPESLGFVFAAGGMAEIEFAGITNPNRLRSDIAAFEALLADVSPELGPTGLIGYWLTQYQPQFSTLADLVETNFSTCQQLLQSGSYRIGGYDIIPSYLLQTKGQRDRLTMHREVVLTEPLKARLKALEKYLAARKQL